MIILIGRQAKERNKGRDFCGCDDERGPKSKVSRRSLKLVSHVMKKAVIPVGRTVES